MNSIFNNTLPLKRFPRCICRYFRGINQDTYVTNRGKAKVKLHMPGGGGGGGGRLSQLSSNKDCSDVTYFAII